jgi:hypothetical protein
MRPAKWTPRYTKILLLHEKGMKSREIAEKVGMNPVSISKVLKKPMFLAKKDKFEETVAEKARAILSSHAISAAKKVVSMMQRGVSSQKLQYEAAKEILYQIGCKPIDVIDDRRKRDYSPEEIKSALGTMLEVESIMTRLSCGNSQFIVEKPPVDVIDAPVVEVEEVIAELPCAPRTVPPQGLAGTQPETSEPSTDLIETIVEDAREASPA